jgi:TRAP-type mannitol/chloroaromatic compound transport system permease small subunit
MSARESLLACARITSSFSRGLARLTGLLIIVMMLGVVTDSLLRGVANVALWGVLELSTMLLLALIYLGLPSTQAERINFRVSVFTDRLPPRVSLALGGLLLLLQLVVLAILCWFTWRSAVFSFTRQEVSIGMVEILLWPHRTLVAFGLTLLWWQALMSGFELLLHGKHPYVVDIRAEVEGAIGRQAL